MKRIDHWLDSSSFHYDFSGFRSDDHEISMPEDDVVPLQWAEIERLKTVRRVKTSLFINQEDDNDEAKEAKIVDVAKLNAPERRLFMTKLIKNVEGDNLRLLKKVRDRIDRVGLKLPTVEVRYKNLCVDAKCMIVEGKPLPTLWNSLKKNFSFMTKVTSCHSNEASISILKDVSGVIKPSRLTLLLGPPGSGKTTLLLALAGQLDKSLKVSGEISYNGYKLDEFVPQKTSAYISQNDLHLPEMTVRETIDFAARCQGVGDRADLLKEVIRREKAAGIIPDLDTDVYMKILGLDHCGDTMVGNEMRGGISGGQKKRLTTGEIIVGPTKALFMDEISNGLDSSTTFQIVTCLQQLAHITDASVLISLLQPAPEVFNLFDDVILVAAGKIIYQGPCCDVLQHFESCGFKCTKRKGVADFLQEVISRKDQAQYWYRTNPPYDYISVEQFSEIFKASSAGQDLYRELSKPFDRSQHDSKELSLNDYSLTRWKVLKACLSREFLLMKRNYPIYLFKTTQLLIVAFMTMTVFIRTRMPVDLKHATYFMGVLFYTLVRLMTNGVAELTMTVARLPVFYKQNGLKLFPAWAYVIPASILKLPVAVVESILWTLLTYYVIGYSPDIERFFYQILLLLFLHQASTSLCRLIAAIFQTDVVAMASGTPILILIQLFGGYIIPRPSLPNWLKWAFWLSPMSYGEIGISLNEFLAPRWQKISTGNSTLGKDILASYGLNFDAYFYWVSLGALFSFMIVYDVGFAIALTYLMPPGMSKAIISRDKLFQLQGKDKLRSMQMYGNSVVDNCSIMTEQTQDPGRMILPFEPTTVSFKNVQYFVDVPQEMKQHGFKEKHIQLLSDVTGAFRPGILTALMGVSGAGKTTLMDVLSGRKTGGIVKGDIRIGGYPKVQKTFARVSGYCEQNDIHSPFITVEESLIYSAQLRLGPEIQPEIKLKFVGEVIQTIELEDIKDSLVGIPGRSGLSTEQRKRLTIAVELVSNPSVIFMDEPTTGLDARAAAIVMRAIRNVVSTGRTTVCTIHQPSNDIFESFDELILMKLGGQIIYSGMLGSHSSKLIEYFEDIPGLPKIKENHNPATWMLEVTSTTVEEEMNVDFSKIYKESSVYRDTLELVEQLSEPPPGSRELHFSTPFPQYTWGQFKACLWKQHLSYWRNPEYNLVRMLFTTVLAVIFGMLFWQKGKNLKNEVDLFSIFGSMYIAVMFLGLSNCSNIIPVAITERRVHYREKFAGMYSSKACSLAQLTIEIPYVVLQAILFVAITYPTIGYNLSAYKIFWFFYATLCSFLFYTYMGLMIVSLSASLQAAIITSVASYTILNLFSGFLIPGADIPKWWIWLYRFCPTSWSLNAFLTSQYGDMNEEILVFGHPTAINSFLEDYFGFSKDHLSLVAVLLTVFPVVFASLFVHFIGKLNFQRR